MFKGMNCDDGKQAEILAAKMVRLDLLSISLFI